MKRRFLYLVIRKQEHLLEVVERIRNIGKDYYVIRGIEEVGVVKLLPTSPVCCIRFKTEESLEWNEQMLLGYDSSESDFLGETQASLDDITAFVNTVGIYLMVYTYTTDTGKPLKERFVKIF